MRIDDNQDCKYSAPNCALIEAAFQQRLPEVAIVCTVRVCVCVFERESVCVFV